MHGATRSVVLAALGAAAAEPPGTGGSSSFTTDADGIITAEMGDIDENGFFHVDEVRSAQMNACLSMRRAENFGGVTYGDPSDAQGLALYDWAVRNQQPCLASRGMETVVPPLEQFVDEQYVPWYLLDQYIWGDGGQLSDLDFDALLEARFACPPAPAYLVDAATW